MSCASPARGSPKVLYLILDIKVAASLYSFWGVPSERGHGKPHPHLNFRKSSISKSIT